MLTNNWCKITFALLALMHWILILISNLLESRNNGPSILNKFIRYGKLSELSKLCNTPTSYFKYFYKLAAFVYTPIGLYQLGCVYVLRRNASDWFVVFLNKCCGNHRTTTVSEIHTIIAFLLFTAQVWSRFYQTHYVSVFSKTAFMPFPNFVLGVAYYMGTVITILSEAPGFANHSADIPLKRHLQIEDVAAIAVFCWAWHHQRNTAAILAELRKNKIGRVITESYKIPHGDWFEYLSSPHCTAEILMYASLWVIMGWSHSWWAVCFLVFANQVDSIIATHNWYKEKFPDFPKTRKAFIPYII